MQDLGDGVYPRNQNAPENRTNLPQTIVFVQGKLGKLLLGGQTSSIFHVYHYFGKWSNSTHIFLRWVAQPTARTPLGQGIDSFQMET